MNRSVDVPVWGPLAVIVPAAAFAVTLPVFFVFAFVAAIIGFVSVPIAVPLLTLALRFGLRRFWQITVLGAVVGMVPFLLWSAYVSVYEGRFAPSQSFFYYEALAAVTGALSGGAYWTLVLQTGGTATGAVRKIFLMYVVALAFVVWPPGVWPRAWVGHETVRAEWQFGEATDGSGIREVRMWLPTAPRCRTSLYYRQLNAYLEQAGPAAVDVRLARLHDWWWQTGTRLEAIGPFDMRGRSDVFTSCVFWQQR